MEIQLASRMDAFQPGIFSVLNDKKRQRISEGKPVWDLSVGTPDFEPDEHVMKAVEEAVKVPFNYTYALNDLPELTEAVQGWYERRYGVVLAPEEIASVNGSQEGIAHIAWTICDPGDIVLVPNPGYPIFSVGPELCGAKLACYDLLEENHYLPDLSAIPEELARKAKAMVVSYPLNPVCKTAPRSFYEELVRFAKRYNIIIIHDNAYSEIVYDGREGGSFLSVPGAKEVGIEFNSLSKSYCLTGARISFVMGNRQIGTCRTARAACLPGRLCPRALPTPSGSARSFWSRPDCSAHPVSPSALWARDMSALPWSYLWRRSRRSPLQWTPAASSGSKRRKGAYLCLLITHFWPNS